MLLNWQRVTLRTCWNQNPNRIYLFLGFQCYYDFFFLPHSASHSPFVMFVACQTHSAYLVIYINLGAKDIKMLWHFEKVKSKLINLVSARRKHTFRTADTFLSVPNRELKRFHVIGITLDRNSNKNSAYIVQQHSKLWRDILWNKKEGNSRVTRRTRAWNNMKKNENEKKRRSSRSIRKKLSHIFT